MIGEIKQNSLTFKQNSFNILYILQEKKMIPFLKKYYKKADNGKMELFGINGYEHGFISVGIHFGTTLITIGYCILLGLPFLMTHKITFIVLGILFLFMRGVWFFVEQFQERQMYEEGRRSTKNFWKFWKWSPDRKQDMQVPFEWDVVYVVLVGLVFTLLKLTFNLGM